MQRAKRILLAAVSVAALTSALSPGARAQTAASADADTTARVRSALHSDSHLLSRHIDVSVKDGVVQLGGLVVSDGDLQRALEDAGAVPGVKSVGIHMTFSFGPPRANGS